jgi:ADP-ribose pyrophosphatase YjhB (NUDIX family)
MNEFPKATAIYVIDQQTTLMGDHKKFRKLCGYGGKMKYGETWQACTCREMEKESRIKIYPDKLIPVALIDFYNGDETEVPFGIPSMQVLFCITREFSGTAVSTDEMENSHWYPFGKEHELPFVKMAAGDRLFLDKVLANMKVKGYIRQNKERTKVLSFKLDPCDASDLTMLPLIEEIKSTPKPYR